MARIAADHPHYREALNWRLWLGLLGAIAFAGIAVASLFYVPFSTAYPAPQDQHLLPGAAHWLGTDGAGRDLASLLMSGTLTSLAVAGLAAILGLVLALPIGIVSAAKPRALGWLSQGSSGLFLILAPIIVAVMGTAVFGPHATIAMVAIALGNFGQSVRLIHRTALVFRRGEVITNARLAGAGDWAIASGHVLPGAWPVLAATAIGQIATGVMWEATLSLINLGAFPPRPSLGLMLADAQASLPGHAWEAILVAIYLLLVIMVFRLLADGVGRAMSRTAATSPGWRDAVA